VFLFPLLGFYRLERQRNSDVSEGLKVTNSFERDARIPTEIEKSFRKNEQRPFTTGIPLLIEGTTGLGMIKTTMEYTRPSCDS